MNQYRPSVECDSFVFYFTLAINTQTTNSSMTSQVQCSRSPVIHNPWILLISKQLYFLRRLKTSHICSEQGMFLID